MHKILGVANEGIRYVLYTFLLSLSSYVIGFSLLGTIFLLLIGALLWIYRDVPRAAHSFSATSFYAPVDGTIVAVEKLENETNAYKIKIESRYIDVSILRVPFDSTLSSVTMQYGARLPKSNPLYETLNENIELVFSNGHFNSVKIKHILKRSLLPFSINVVLSQSLRQNDIYGVLPNGITEIYIPYNFRLNSKLGDKLKASESLIGNFIPIP